MGREYDNDVADAIEIAEALDNAPLDERRDDFDDFEGEDEIDLDADNGLNDDLPPEDDYDGPDFD